MKTAQKILDEHGCPEIPFDEIITMRHPAIIEAMEEYAGQLPDSFRAFIRTHHLTAKWDEFINRNNGNEGLIAYNKPEPEKFNTFVNRLTDLLQNFDKEIQKAERIKSESEPGNWEIQIEKSLYDGLQINSQMEEYIRSRILKVIKKTEDLNQLIASIINNQNPDYHVKRDIKRDKGSK